MLTALGTAAAFIVGKLFARKVLIKIAIIGIDHLVKVTKVTWDDELWKPLREELEKELV